MKTKLSLIVAIMAVSMLLNTSCNSFNSEQEEYAPYTEIVSATVKGYTNGIKTKSYGNVTLSASAIMDNGRKINLGSTHYNKFSVRYLVKESHDNVYWLTQDDAVLHAPSKGEMSYLVTSEITYNPTGTVVKSEEAMIIVKAPAGH